MAQITWRGGSGNWADPAGWTGGTVPGALDVAEFGAGDTGTATLDAGATVGGVAFESGSLATLLLAGTLDLPGTLALAGGTLALAPGGTIEGGTVDLAGGAVVASGGVADGVVWLAPLGGGLVITAATATATEAALGSLAVAGTLTLEGGAYLDRDFVADTYQTVAAEIDALAHGTVTLGPGTAIRASADDPLHESGVAPSRTGLTFGGTGTFDNQGLIVSDLAASLAPLSVTAFGFSNEGTIALQASVVDGAGQGTPGGDATLAPGLILRGAAFANANSIVGQAATLLVQSRVFANSGLILLTPVPADDPLTTLLGGSIEISDAVTSFVNTGLMSAATIQFDGGVSLGELGTLRGDLLFAGTLELGGGTLDIGQFDPGHAVRVTGTVLDGVLVVDGGTLVTTGAVLSGVATFARQAGVVDDVASGTVALGAVTTDLAYATAASIDDVSVIAGVPGTTDRIEARAPGTLRFGAGTLITDTVAGSTLAIDGPGTFSDAGRIVLAGATAGIAMLGGTATIALADGAALALGGVAPASALTVAFGAGTSTLTLPDTIDGGVTLAGLAVGDVLDFAGLASGAGPAALDAGNAVLVGGTLYVFGGSGQTARVAVAGPAAGLGFVAGADGSGGTLVMVACFRRGTRLATPRGPVAVERLRVGDAVRTAGGAARPVRWIGRRAYDAATVGEQPQLRPVRLAPGALGPGRPARALYLSALHGVLLRAPDGADVLVPAAALVGCPGISRAAVAAVAYLHVELDAPDILIAEGVATESFVDRGSRALFDDAADHSGPPPGRERFAAPLLDQGWRLHAIRAALLGEGGGVAAPGRRPRWHVDHAADGRIEGWALDDALPAAPVALALLAGGRRLGCHVANQYRPDLDRAGLAGGACGFAIDVPRWARDVTLRTLAGAVLLAH